MKFKEHTRQLTASAETLTIAVQKAQQAMLNFGKAYEQEILLPTVKILNKFKKDINHVV